MTMRRSSDGGYAPGKPKTDMYCIGKASMLLMKLVSAAPVRAVAFEVVL